MSHKPNEMPEEIFAALLGDGTVLKAYPTKDYDFCVSYTRTDLVQELRRDKEDLEIRHATVMLYTQSVVDENNRFRKVCEAIAEMEIPPNDIHPNVLQECCYRAKELAQVVLKDAAMNHERKEGE